jgi:zinc transporter
MTNKVSDNRGLICGFILHEEAPAEHLLWDAASQAFINHATVWLHFNLVDSRARNWIAKCDRIPELARETLLSNSSRISLETVENGIVGVLGDLHYEFSDDPDELGLLQVYIDDTLIITGRTHPLKAIDRLRRELMAGECTETPIHILVHLLQHVTEIFSTETIFLNDKVDNIEDGILKEWLQGEAGELGRLRRLLVRLRRHVSAEHNALFYVSKRMPSWCSETDLLLLQQAIERLDSVAQDLGVIQERGRLLHEEISSQLEGATNRNLYVLSMVTIVFLPLTLITGIFGMNVGGLPWVEDKFGFGWTMFNMAITAIVTLYILRRRQFF